MKGERVNLLVVALLALVSMGFAWSAFGHGELYTADEIAWMERQRAVDGTKCCNEHDVHLGINVTWRMRGGNYEVYIKGMDTWMEVPQNRLYQHKAHDPSPFPGETLLFFSTYGTSVHIWCFSPSGLY